MPHQNRISRVVLKNYKSLRECDVSLGPITFLVGPNGAGKSNFVEALRFLSYALSSSLEQALDALSGFRSIIHSGLGPASSLTLEINFQLADDTKGSYLAQIGAGNEGPVNGLLPPPDPEAIRGAREWLSRNVVPGRQYSPSVDQAALVANMDLMAARSCPSFDRLCREIERLVVSF